MGGGHLLLTADAIGGVWQYSTGLAGALQPFGYQVTLAVLGPSLTDEQRREVAAIPNLHVMETGQALEWLAEAPEPVLMAEKRLAEMAADLRVDVVQLHTPALVSAGRFSCPVVAVLHSCVATWWSAVRGAKPMPQDFEWRSALVAKGLAKATLDVAPSAAFAEVAFRQYGVRPVTVHNGRSLEVRRRAMQDHVFTAGRLWDEGKNVRVLDAAAQQIAVPFKAAGPMSDPGGQTVCFEALAALGNLGAAALAEQLGSQPVFASAALYEPFGLAVLEAALAGCALVLSDIPTFRELWEGAAVFVDPGDAEGFAHAIEGYLGDRAARIEAGERARERAGTYTVEAMAARMSAHYASIQRRVAA